MNTFEAITRPDRWQVVGGAERFKVIRDLPDGTRVTHRGRDKPMRRGGPIVFRHLAHAQARADRLKMDDAKAGQIDEAMAVSRGVS